MNNPHGLLRAGFDIFLKNLYDSGMKITINKLPKSQVEIIGIIETDDFESFRGKAMKHLAEHADLPGFRQGHVPEAVLAGSIGEMTILDEMAEIALESRYPEILIANKIDAIGRPHVNITKIAKGNPLEFKIETAVVPEIELPDYKKIAGKITAKKEEIKVTEEEVNKVILEIRKQRAGAQEHVHEEGEAHDHEHKHEHAEIKEEDLPPMDEEFFKGLGAFKDLEELKTKIKENLGHEKEQQAKEKIRMSIIKDILGETKMEIPDILVHGELERMIAQFKHDVTQMGLKFEDYLAHIKKTEDDMRKEWLKDAEDRAKTQLVIDKIAENETIVPEKDLVEKEVAHILEHYGDADADRARDYVNMIMTNEKVLDYLEETK